MSDEREYVKYQYAVMGCCRQIVNVAATNAAIYFSVLRDDGQGWVEVCRINPAPYNAVVPQRVADHAKEGDGYLVTLHDDACGEAGS